MNGKVLEFGPFRLDPALQQLLRRGVRVRVPASQIRLLLLFLTRHKEMITREEIAACLWKDSSTVDEVSGINTAVNRLRRRLGDDPAAPKYIETVVGVGYRFVAEVVEIERQDSPGTADSSDTDPVRQSAAPPALIGGAWAAEPGNQELDLAEGQAPGRVLLPSRSIEARIAVFLRKNWIAATTTILLAISTPIAYYFMHSMERRSAAPTPELELTQVSRTGDIEFADISPDGKYIALVRDTGGEETIWLKQLVTGRLLKLVELGSDECPGLAFSPDAAFVYFARKKPNEASGDLYSVPFLGGSAIKLLTGISGAPAISPDGRTVAFVRSTLATHGIDSIVVADIDGTNARVLASYSAPGIHLNRLTWTADGQELVYPSQNTLMTIPANGGTAQMVSEAWTAVDDVSGLAPGEELLVVGVRTVPGPSQIYLDPGHGGTIRPITHDFSDYTEVRSTGDGKAVLGVKTDVLTTLQTLSPGKEAEPVALSVANSDHDGVSGLALTPEGGVVYVSYSDRKQALTLIDREGASPRPVVFDVFSAPAVSPGGGTVAVARWSNGDRANLFLVDLKSGRETRLTDGKQDLSPSYTPDGEWIVYASIQNDKAVLMKVPGHGGVPARLTDYNADHPSVSPDGAWIACIYDAEPDRPPVLAIVPIAGGPPKLTFALSSTAAPSPLVWAPDGKSVSFINDVHGVSNIWQQPISGGPAAPVTHFTTGKIFNFQWSHRGRLVLSRGSEMTDAVLIKGF